MKSGWAGRIGYWAPPILYMALIFRISGHGKPSETLFAIAPDVGWHTLAYMGLGFLLYRLFVGRFSEWTPTRMFSAAWILGALYGASDEFHQSFVPTRHMTLSDWIADFIGAGLGAALGWAFYGLLHKRRAARRGALTVESLDTEGGTL